ncbi:hypothetical protein K1719_033149 [Acacia pycnantha]|nr:hypothetical protein K1719_033149 [Acacia pycnantha]
MQVQRHRCNPVKADGPNEAHGSKAVVSASRYEVLSERLEDEPIESQGPLIGPVGGKISKPNAIHGNDPLSISRGLKLSSRVTIHKLGSKPIPDKAGPSTSLMKQVARDMQNDIGPWVLAGDFNAILSHDERKRGSLRKAHGCKLFNKSWNTETFGHIGKRKKFLFRRINGLQAKLEEQSDTPLDFLVDLETSLRGELEEVCFQEELLWLQKSSSEWICLGDRNTSYYHMKALIRRKKNFISKLKHPDGSWISNND